jgi:uncharacterized protein (TIGR00369 family)
MSAAASAREPSGYHLWIAGRGPAPRYASFLGLTLLEADEGRASFRWQPTSELFNFTGRVTGGFTATCIDFFSFVAAMTLFEPSELATTAHMDVEFFRPIGEGSYRGKGEVVRRTRRSVWADGAVYDEGERVCARGTQLILPLEP